MICALTVIPLAYYAISLRHHPEIGFSEFWWNMVTKGPWPSGPIWFLWVLFAFDLIACLLYRLSPNLLDPINRLSLYGRRRPAVFFAVMLAVTAAFYVPGLMIYGPSSWFEFGPFSVQHGRVHALCDLLLLRRRHRRRAYGSRAACSRRPDGEGQLGLDGAGDRPVLPAVGPDLHQARNPGQSVAAAELVRGDLRRLLRRLQRGHHVSDPGLLSGFRQSGSAKLLDPMQADAYGMFLVHYPIALWLQYWLFDYDLPAIVKVAIGLTLTVALSWALTRALRQIPGATKVL